VLQPRRQQSSVWQKLKDENDVHSSCRTDRRIRGVITESQACSIQRNGSVSLSLNKRRRFLVRNLHALLTNYTQIIMIHFNEVLSVCGVQLNDCCTHSAS
jgi:hypothetical protein